MSYSHQPYPPAGQQPYPVTDQRQGTARAASATHAWIWTALTCGYMFPWALAASRGAANSAGVFWVNLLAGWTLIGWIVALVMAFSRHQYMPQPVVVQTYPQAQAAPPVQQGPAGPVDWAAQEAQPPTTGPPPPPMPPPPSPAP